MGEIELTVGERYAYRAAKTESLVEVELLKIGTQKPARVHIRWTDNAFEGRQDWVPPARLKALWSAVSDFIATEKRWADLLAVSPRNEGHELSAATQLYDLVVDYDIADIGYRNGVTEIKDMAKFTELTGMAADEFTSEPLGFDLASGSRVVSWPTSLQALKAIATNFSDQIAETVTQAEAKAQYEAVHGSRSRHGNYSAEICRKVDEEYGQPVREILRGWCGSEALERADELTALREEVRRIGLLTSEAIDRLEKAGEKAVAADLRRRLGVPIEDL